MPIPSSSLPPTIAELSSLSKGFFGMVERQNTSPSPFPAFFFSSPNILKIPKITRTSLFYFHLCFPTKPSEREKKLQLLVPRSAEELETWGLPANRRVHGRNMKGLKIAYLVTGVSRKGIELENSIWKGKLCVCVCVCTVPALFVCNSG